MKRKITSESKGITEIVGTMLLLVIAVILFTTVYFSVLSLSPNPATPSAYIVGTINDNNEIVLEHFGGSSMPDHTKILLSLDGLDVPLTIESIIEDTNNNDKWDIGEYLFIDSQELRNKQVTVTIVDPNSNSIVMNSIIQERPSEILDPFVTTGQATQITSDSANLKLEYNFRGISGFVYFRYKEDGGSWKISTENESNGRGSFEQDITGLESNVTYIYQAVLKYNTSQFTYGEFKSFKTKESILETEITDISFSLLSPNTITINASSTGGIDPDNITLYYRWSNNEKFINTASWWNSNWKHRKLISLTNPIKAYQLRLEIGNTSGGDFSCDGHIGKDDFSDLRFISYKDNQTVYPMWQESIIQDTQTLIWCNLTDNSSKLWVYYGNSLAESRWNGEKTFDFFDDFNENDLNSSKWYQYGGKKLQFSNGILSITANNNDPSKIIAITAPTGNMSVLRARFKADNSNNKDERIGLGIKTGLTDGNGYNYVLHDFKNLDEISFLDDKVDWSERYESWTKNNWYIFEIYHDGYQVYGRHDDNIWLNEPWSGRIGYPALNIGSENAESYWDWALVRKKSHSPPIISEITSEETYSGSTELSIDWKSWNNQSNPKTIPPWDFNFDFPNGFGYYEFYSIGQNTTANSEAPPTIADASFFISFDDFSGNQTGNFTGGQEIEDGKAYDLDYYGDNVVEGVSSYCLGLRNDSGAYWKLNDSISADTNEYSQIIVKYNWRVLEFDENGYWTFEYYKESTDTWEIVSKYLSQNFSEDDDSGRFTEWLNESDGYELSDSFNIRFVCYTDNDDYTIGNYQLLLDNIYIIAVRK